MKGATSIGGRDLLAIAGESRPTHLTQLSAWWVSLGIEVVRSRPGKRQDNGGHERMHLDVRFELEDFAAATLADQQCAFDDWVKTFNHVRPHEALGQKLPAEVYRVSDRRISRRVPFVHPDDRRVVQIDRQGWVRYDDRGVYISYGLGGQNVGLEAAADGTVRAWFHRMLLGVFVPRGHTTIQPYDPETVRVEERSVAADGRPGERTAIDPVAAR